MIAGRKPHPALVANPNEPVVLEGELEQALADVRQAGQALTQAESQRQATVRAVAQQIGYQLPGNCADPDLIQRDIASNMRRTAETMFQVGIGLICLKEACPHGEFLARLEVLRLEPRVAQRYMQVAKRLVDTQTSAHLLKAIDSQSKLLELIVLDDEQLGELALTGQTGELKLDAAASMSVRELRAKVRELTAEVAAKEERITVHRQLRDEAEEQARGFKKLLPNDQADVLLAEAGKTVNAALAKINGEFRQALLALEALDQSAAGIKDFRPLAAGLAGQLQQSLTIIRDEFLLTDIVGDGTPEWMRATADLADEA